MPINFDELNYIIGDNRLLDHMKDMSALPAFDDGVLHYLDAVSKLLLSSKESKQFPDVITFAFWCRKASLLNKKKSYENDNGSRIGRGVAFHIAPSNVAVNFAYSLVVGMLAGNANIVRIPSKEYPQVNIICNAFHMALTKEIKPYLCLLKYGHEKDITDYLSSLCDTRVIWGGDETIAAVRKSLLNPRSTEITFADRFSICIINSDEYIKADNKQNITQGFFNDTYLNDQNACTSPRIVIWLGSRKEEAKEMFWCRLHSIVEERYDLQPVQAISKYVTLCKFAAERNAKLIASADNNIIRVQTDSIDDTIMNWKGNSGFFIEYDANSLDEILPLCTSQCQTLSYYGFESNDLKQFIMDKRPRGIDRIVPIGRTLDFSLNWDGFDLINSLTRKIETV